MGHAPRSRNPLGARADLLGRVGGRLGWLLAVLPLLPCLWVGFLLDDWIGLAQLLDGGWPVVASQFRPEGGPFLRPLGWLVFQVELASFGVHAPAFHAVHLGLFVGAAWLTGRLAVRIAEPVSSLAAPGGRVVGWAAALALLYPGRTEAYAWLAAIFDLLVLVAGLAILLLHLRCRRRPTGGSAAGLAILALLSTLAKESSYAVLAVILVWEALPGVLEPAPRRGRFVATASAAGGFGLGILYRWVTLGGMGGYPGTSVEGTLDQLGVLPGIVLRAALVPVHPGYDGWSTALGFLCAASFGGVLATGIFATQGSPRVRRVLLAGASLALLGLLPVLPYLSATAHWTQSRFLTLFGVGMALIAAAPMAVAGRGARGARWVRGALVALLFTWGAGSVVNLLPWLEAARSRDVILRTVGQDTTAPGPHVVWVAGPINSWRGAHLLGGALEAALRVTYPRRRIEADSAFLQRWEGRPVRLPRSAPGVQIHLYRCQPHDRRMRCAELTP